MYTGIYLYSRDPKEFDQRLIDYLDKIGYSDVYFPLCSETEKNTIKIGADAKYDP